MRRNYSEVNQLFFFKSINFCNILTKNMLCRIIFILIILLGSCKNEKGKADFLVWEKNLPAVGYATPINYEVDGKQFIVIACGGGKMGTPSGDSYVAFSLKKNK